MAKLNLQVKRTRVIIYRDLGMVNGLFVTYFLTYKIRNDCMLSFLYLAAVFKYVLLRHLEDKSFLYSNITKILNDP